jgi:hypothetical protein
MRTLELFCGTKSFSKMASRLGHTTFTIDNDNKFNPDKTMDVLDIDEEVIRYCDYDIIWASPPCEAFSVAAIGKNWYKEKYRNGRIPKSPKAEYSLRLLDKTIKIIALSDCKYWFIENPRGMMRIVIDDVFKKHGITDYRRVTVSYCQYGDSRMKPIDIWTNLKGWQGKLCKNGDKCHMAAPRGSRTGTQGLKGAAARAVIPGGLFIELFSKMGVDTNGK